MYRVLADGVLVVHLAFILLVIAGGLLALRWRRLPWLHLPALTWGMLATFNHWRCPLTPLENHLRLLGGQAGYDDGFIAHYLLPIIYPPGLQPQLEPLALLVLGLNGIGYGVLLWQRQKRRRQRPRGPR
nr:DUF2784 domain-containing protein [Motiliproteus sp. SC1-56]